MSREHVSQIAAGYLTGPCPNGEQVTIAHPEHGYTGYRLHWKGVWHNELNKTRLPECFGIPYRPKKSGAQEGFSSEPAIKAIWRYLANRWNSGDPSVHFSRVAE